MSHAEVVRKRTKIEPTATDAGLRLVVEVAAYDSGIVTVDGQPTSPRGRTRSGPRRRPH